MNPNKTFFSDILTKIDEGFASKDPYAASTFSEYIKDCHQFIFSPLSVETQDLGRTEEEVDLPYPCIHVEVAGSYITVPDLSISDLVSAYTCSIIVKEIGPREYKFLTLSRVVRGGSDITQLFEVNKRDDVVAWEYYNSLVIHYLKRLSREKIGIESGGQKVRLGVGKGKFFYKPSKITHICPKRDTHAHLPLNLFKTIDWAARWEVRGHWRKSDTIGKNRSGGVLREWLYLG
jgi:hypothetical protein